MVSMYVSSTSDPALEVLYVPLWESLDLQKQECLQYTHPLSKLKPETRKYGALVPLTIHPQVLHQHLEYLATPFPKCNRGCDFINIRYMGRIPTFIKKTQHRNRDSKEKPRSYAQQRKPKKKNWCCLDE